MEGRSTRGRRGLSLFCSLTGFLVVLLVVASCAPVAFARLGGYEVYNVVSGSMEPEIPVGSLIYVEKAEPEEILSGEVIAFWSGQSVVVHRVLENHRTEREFITKGDANAAEDLYGAKYSSLIGRMAFRLPMAGPLLALYTGRAGKVCAICFAAVGALLSLLGGRLRAGQKE